MAKAKKRAGRKAVKKKRKVIRRKPAAAAGPAPAPASAPAPAAPRPVLIPGAWPFPMGSKP